MAGILSMSFPVVMKVVGPIHKTDVGGVVLNVSSLDEASFYYDQLMQIEGAQGVLAQSMLRGIELFLGVHHEALFGRTILCGLGGIFIEVLKDVSAGLSPISRIEAQRMVRGLKGYELIKGARGKKGVNESLFCDIIQRLSALTMVAPEIVEMDINPLLGNETEVIAVDTRIKISRNIESLIANKQ
jgi:acetyltransferase